MDIQEALNRLSQSLRNGCDHTLQITKAASLTLYKYRNNPEFFQKICQIACQALQLLAIHSPKFAYLERFSVTLRTVGMQDVYNTFKLPRQWFFPVRAETIDENGVLNSLVEILRQNQIPQDLHQGIQACLQAQLKQMGAHDDSYATVEEFKDVLQRRLSTVNNGAYHHIQLTNLRVPLRQMPFLERLTNWNFTLVDFGCLGIYLQEWQLLDTAKWAQRVGQYSSFNPSLPTCVAALVTSGFALKLIEATRKLLRDALTPEERKLAQWNCGTSTLELIASSAFLLNHLEKIKISTSLILFLAIFAKAVGLLSIICKPSHQFFQQPAAARLEGR